MNNIVKTKGRILHGYFTSIPLYYIQCDPKLEVRFEVILFYGQLPFCTGQF